MFINDVFIALAILGDILLIYQIVQEQKNLHPKIRELKEYPTVSIIVPKKGYDPNFCENMKSLLEQDYPGEYEVIYVIDEPVEDCIWNQRVKVLRTEDTCLMCSGKIRSQLTGLKYARGEVIAFADSDTFYPKNWLRDSVALLQDYDAVTTFSWPKPVRATLKNLVRAGFWTLGFESQFSQGSRFLWGGSMVLKRDFFTKDVVDELSREWCDDCTLTRVLKREGKRIAFSIDIEPLNYYDEVDLLQWMKRQILTVKKYSPRGAKAFLFVGAILLAMLVYSIIFLNAITFSPFLLWFIKNVLRGWKYKGLAIVAALMSVISLPFTFVMLVINWNKKEVTWRGVTYSLEKY